MNSLVQYTTDRGVAVLTLSDPPDNAYTFEMMKELDAAILEARFDNDVHVLVLTGHGETHFSVGPNLNVLRETDPAFHYYFTLHAGETMARLEATPKLCIAALNGRASSGGLELALAADLRVARRGVAIGLTDVELGLLPAAGGIQRLVRAVGKSRALGLIAQSTLLTAEEALGLGLVHRIVEAESHEAFVAEAVSFARTFCPPHGAPLALGRLKRAVHAGAEMALGEAVSLDRELAGALLTTADAKEGLGSYGRRRPTFRGR